MIKKITLVCLFSLTIVACKSKKVTLTEKTSQNYSEQVRNDFRAVSEKVQKEFLKSYKATEDEFSILFFTKGFFGEEISVNNNNQKVFKGLMLSDKKTGLAKNMRILNTQTTEIYDAGTNQKIIIEKNQVDGHKFIYIMKDTSNKEKPYKITYSNKLRPAK